ncbi:hypothetical protein PHYPSEUDO_014488 [Phytophthora pseudosyringae]|uniref:RxLR effector protein n=1 Tax=Phytophthora pseudosyringae TaxID=221518 RepID=A0A8T1W644_9STRA|nr:hypothetical protein PHYPSEUDO_014488 [Phytophthora pseudosyringae]
MVLSRALVLLCVATVVALSETGVGAELASPLRQLEEEVVKVHVKVHQKDAAPEPKLQDTALLGKHMQKHHRKEGKGETTENGETVRNYDHGTVRIESKGAKAGKKLAKGHHQKEASKKKPTDETVVEYKHGSVKTSGEKMADSETKGKAKKAATPDEKEVASTANEVNELVTKLSSTDSRGDKSFVDAYGPVVVICGIIGGLAAIIGVAGLVMGQPQPKDDNLDSVLSSSDLDVDVEANVTLAEVQDATDDGDDLLSDSDSDVIDDVEEEEGTFANGTTHVSV